jgi:hypothetical protein
VLIITTKLHSPTPQKKLHNQYWNNNRTTQHHQKKLSIVTNPNQLREYNITAQ